MLTFPHWFGRALKPPQRASKRNVRRKLRLEELEGRHLLSAVAIDSHAALIDPPGTAAMVAAPTIAVQNAPDAAKSGSPLVAGINVKRFNGTYAGKYVGWVDGEIESGTIRFTVSNGLVRVTSPGKGSGRIDAKGNVSFRISGGVKLRGHFNIAAGAGRASGTWTMAQGSLRGSGSWNAAVVRVNPAKFNGAYAGKYSGKVSGWNASGAIRFTVSNGLVKVTSPGKGSGRIDSQGNVNFAITGGIRLKGHFSLAAGAGKAAGTWAMAQGLLRGGGSWNASRNSTPAAHDAVGTWGDGEPNLYPLPSYNDWTATIDASGNIQITGTSSDEEGPVYECDLQGQGQWSPPDSNGHTRLTGQVSGTFAHYGYWEDVTEFEASTSTSNKDVLYVDLGYAGGGSAVSVTLKRISG